MKSSFEDIRILVGPHKKSSFEKFGGNYLKSHFLRLLILVVLNGFTLFVGWFEKLCCKCDCGTKSVLLGIISTMDFIYPNRYIVQHAFVYKVNEGKWFSTILFFGCFLECV
jgi:hypothetical protein